MIVAAPGPYAIVAPELTTPAVSTASYRKYAFTILRRFLRCKRVSSSKHHDGVIIQLLLRIWSYIFYYNTTCDRAAADSAFLVLHLKQPCDTVALMHQLISLNCTLVGALVCFCTQKKGKTRFALLKPIVLAQVGNSVVSPSVVRTNAIHDFTIHTRIL